MSILQNFKSINNTNVSIYVEAFGDDDYETRCNKLLIIDKIKQDKHKLAYAHCNSYRDYEMMLHERYQEYKQSINITGAIGDEGGGLPSWFRNAVRYNTEIVKCNGKIVTYSE